MPMEKRSHAIDPIYDTSRFLPTTRAEMERLGWDQADIILFSGDAYVDHPSFAAAVLGRYLQSAGYKVAIVPQPNWRDDLRDFRKLGRPRLFFGVSAGAMDSMVNHYTAARRLRHDDAYTPGGRHGMRPDYPTIVYSKILKELFPVVPVIAGGIEASMRRLAHYDYWQDALRPSILAESAADMIVYGMGERPLDVICRELDAGRKLKELTDIPQTVVRLDSAPSDDADNIILASYEECMRSKRAHAANFRHIEEEANRWQGASLWQKTGSLWIKVNPMFPPADQKQTDRSFDLPYTRLPHPRYKGKVIPAYDMIRHSVCMHRGCFGGCAFCTISAHQGKFISSRSPESIIREVKQVAAMHDFKGYVSDLGGPSANMYGMSGHDQKLCRKCRRPSCLHPVPCKNLNNDHRPLLDIYNRADKVGGVKKTLVSSGVRYDLSFAPHRDAKVQDANKCYLEQLITKHVGGRLKVAPEHTSEAVLNIMRKPSFGQFEKLNRFFNEVNNKHGLRQQLIPYFISSHPGCTEVDMAELAVRTKNLNFHLEQVQDFTPTPMTVSTETYYTGLHPYTLEPVYSARTPKEKETQRRFFFWYDPEQRSAIRDTLSRLGRRDLLLKLYGDPKVQHPRSARSTGKNKSTGSSFPDKRLPRNRKR